MKADYSLGCFIILLSLLGGVLLAGPLVDASGLLTEDNRHEFTVMLQVACGILTALILVFGMRTLLHVSLSIIASLQRTEMKPSATIAMTLIVGGTLCLLATLWLEYQMVSRVAPQQSSVQVQGNEAHLSLATGWGRPASVLLISRVFTGLVFLVGSAMIATGVWSSIPPCPKPAAP